MHSFELYESNVRSYCRVFPVVFSRASGPFLYDEEGRHYLDFLSGAGSLNYGHNNPQLKAAIIDYLERDGVTLSLDLATTSKREFIERFQSIVLAPRGLDYKQQFTGPTGANGVEAALKLARKVTGRSNIVAFTGAYHGLSSGALAVTANAYYRHESFISRGNVSFLPYDGYVPDLDSLNFLRKTIEDNSSGVDLPAAIILETIQAEGGINIASDEWLRGVEKLCRAHRILMIVDDIQVGNGRTGSYFSFESSGIHPDIVILSKSIGGFGLPMSLVLLRPELDAWLPGEHTGTFRGNNLAFVAGAKALGYWQNDRLEKQIRLSEHLLSSGLEKLVQQSGGTLKERRGRGMIWGLEASTPEVAKKIRTSAFEHGLIVELCGGKSNVIKLLPALTIEKAQLREGLSILEQSVMHAMPERLERAATGA